MKKLLIKFVTGLAAIILSASVISSNAQDVPGLVSKLNISAPALQVLKDAQTAGILNPTNYAIEPYLTYAPNNKAKDYIGGGVLALYNFNQYVGAGLGADYLGRFSLVSGNVSLKVPINIGAQIDRYLPSSWSSIRAFADEVTVVPFGIGGIGAPLSGTDSSVSVIADVGAYVQYGHLWGGKFNTGLCWGKWSNAGDYSGTRYHLFAGWSKGF